MPDEAPKITPLRSFNILRNREVANLAVLELTTPEGAVRYAVTREILTTLSDAMTKAAANMTEAQQAAGDAAVEGKKAAKKA